MSKKSAQDLGADSFKDTWLKIASHTRELDPEDRDDFVSELRSWFAYPWFTSLLRQAVLQLLADNEDRIQESVSEELTTILTMVPKVADPEDPNTQKIMAMLQDFIAERKQTDEELDDDEVNALVPDEEDDSNPMGDRI